MTVEDRRFADCWLKLDTEYPPARAANATKAIIPMAFPLESILSSRTF